MLNLATSLLRTDSRKFPLKYIGPFFIFRILNTKEFLLMTVNGRNLPRVIEFEGI